MRGQWRASAVACLLLLAGCSDGSDGSTGSPSTEASAGALPAPAAADDGPLRPGTDRWTRLGYTVDGLLNNGSAEDVKSFLGCHGDAGTVENVHLNVGAYAPVLEFSCYMARGSVSSDVQAPVFFLRYDSTRSGALLPVDWAKAAADHFGTEDGVSTTGARVTYHAEALSGYPIMAISHDTGELQAVNSVLAQY